MDARKGGRSGDAMAKRHKHRKSNLLYNQTAQHSLAALICGILFAAPSLCSSATNHFLLMTSFPYIWSSLCNPKCLFVVVNVIIIFLVGESRRGASTSASPVSEIFEEYVKRSRRMRRAALVQEEKLPDEEEKSAGGGERSLVATVKELGSDGDGTKTKNMVVDEKEEGKKATEKENGEGGLVLREALMEVKKKVVDENYEEEKQAKEKQEEKEEEGGLMPMEELNKRVEAFIARVNKQRRMESRLAVCC